MGVTNYTKRYNNTVLLIIFLISISTFAQADKIEKIRLGDKAYDFIGYDDLNNLVKISEYNGSKYVLLNFTHTFCGPCWPVYEQLNIIQEQYKKNLIVISLHLDDKREKWNKTAKKRGINFNCISIWKTNIEKQKINDIYDVNGFPYFVLIDLDGKVIQKWLGNKEKKLKRKLEKHIRN